MIEQGPLFGIRVLDATSNIAGPWGGTVLGDLGAEVVKIESPGGDPARSMVPTEGDRSAYFHVVNRNKEAVTIDLKSNEGKNRLSELLDNADVFLTNFLPEQLEKLGLTAQQLMKERPRLIIGHLSSYGSEGADSSWPGYDATLQARTGIMHVTGERDGPPVRAGVSILDIGAGTWLALGILAALIQRDRTGIGSLVETSLFETGGLWVSYHLAAYEIGGAPSFRSGSGHPAFSPYGVFKTKVGELCIGVGNNNIFNKLCTALNRPELIENPLYKENVDRVAHKTSLTIELERSLLLQSAEYWSHALSLAGVAAEQVLPPEQLLSDAQAEAMKLLIPYPDSTSSVKRLPGLPLRFDGVRPAIRKPAPHRDGL